jgi:hypothetical protein
LRLHSRLTVVDASDPGLAGWMASLVDAGAGAVRADDLRFASGVSEELERWDLVLTEARARLAHAHATAPRVDASDLAEGARLYGEWRYATKVAEQASGRRGTRRQAAARRELLERFLARFGASSVDDLAVVGTGVGDSPADTAIREAATVVSMAEQRRNALKAEHALLDGERADRLLADALATREGSGTRGPILVDRVLDLFEGDARRRGYERLLLFARRRQTIVVTACADVMAWAAGGPSREVSMQVLGPAGAVPVAQAPTPE